MMILAPELRHNVNENVLTHLILNNQLYCTFMVSVFHVLYYKFHQHDYIYNECQNFFINSCSGKFLQ